MKQQLIFVITAFTLAVTLAYCNSNGNTGNGGNDPTSQYEPNNIKDPKDLRPQGKTDSITNAADTTATENRY